MKYFNIQTVSKITGISTHCIRAWEKRYQALTPARSENGRRLYSEAELNRLKMLSALSSMGNSIGIIAKLADEELLALLGKIDSLKGQEPVGEVKNLIEPKVYLSNLLMALQSYKLDVFTHEMNKASMDLSCKDFALKIVAALFNTVGEYVQEGKMTLAQEHTLSAITKFYIGKRIGQHYSSGKKSKLRFTLATPSGERHCIGLLLSSLLLVEHGIDFVYLGEDLPVESLAEAAQATDSEVILLGISSAFGENSMGIDEVALNLKKQLPTHTQLWIGGAVDQLKISTIKEARLTTFSRLEELDQKLTELTDSPKWI